MGIPGSPTAIWIVWRIVKVLRATREKSVFTLCQLMKFLKSINKQKKPMSLLFNFAKWGEVFFVGMSLVAVCTVFPL